MGAFEALAREVWARWELLAWQDEAGRILQQRYIEPARDRLMSLERT